MSKIIELIKSNKCDYLGVIDSNIIEQAEKKLGIKFSEEIKEYISQFGILSYGEHEINGLGTDSYLNIVKATLSARTTLNNFPKDMMVIEDIGGNGLLILIDTYNNIYEWNGISYKHIYNSFYDYLKNELKL